MFIIKFYLFVFFELLLWVMMGEGFCKRFDEDEYVCRDVGYEFCGFLGIDRMCK